MCAVQHSNRCQRNKQHCQTLKYEHGTIETFGTLQQLKTKSNVYKMFSFSLLVTRVNFSALFEINFFIFMFFTPPYFAVSRTTQNCYQNV
jgi:hypothetical protein